jgi:hypothetical protein
MTKQVLSLLHGEHFTGQGSFEKFVYLHGTVVAFRRGLANGFPAIGDQGLFRGAVES